MRADSGVYHIELSELPPRDSEGEKMDAVFDGDDSGAKSRQPLESPEMAQLLFNRRFYCTRKVLIL